MIRCGLGSARRRDPRAKLLAVTRGGRGPGPDRRCPVSEHFRAPRVLDAPGSSIPVRP